MTNEANTVPGEFVTDEIGRIIVSYSSLRAFRACRRKYFWRYLRHLVPLALRPGDPRTLGKAIHAAREGLSKNMNVDDLLLAFWGDVSDDHSNFMERERSRAMLRGYRKRWLQEEQADVVGDWAMIEVPFVGDIEHPTTGEAHQRFCAGGKVDGIIRVERECLWGEDWIEPGWYQYELKSASKVDGKYLAKLWLDFQLLWYSHYMEDGLLSEGIMPEGEQLKGSLYDVIEKTKLEHTLAEPEADFDARYAELMEKAKAGEINKSEKGGAIKQRRNESEDEFKARCIEGATAWVESTCKRVEREPDERYAERLDAVYDNPERFARAVVPISREHRDDIRRNVWELLWEHEQCEGRDYWGKNEDQCFGFFRACDYLPICKSLDSELEIENNFRLKAPHSEQVESDLPIVD